MKTNVRLGLLFVLFLVVTTPHLVSAAGNASDIQCQKQCNAIPQKQRPTICPTLVCIDITNGGRTTGHCTYPVIKCKGEATSGGAGQAGGGLGMSQLLSALTGLMKALNSPSSPSSGSGAGSSPTTGAGGCSTFYQTSIQGNPDPCSYYVPDTTLPVDTFPLPTTTLPTIPAPIDPICPTYTPTTIQNDPSPCTIYTPPPANPSPSVTTPAAPSSSKQGFVSVLLNNVVGANGSGGNIEVTGNRGTIYVGNADQKTNTSVVGFYGSNGAQSQSVVGRLCTSRPWASSFLSFLIAPTFFDGLCKSRGYLVGPAAPTATVVVRKPATPRQATTTPSRSATTTPGVKTVPPQADIWAAPSSVPLGTRTTVFWNSRGAVSCIVSSPDGSFSETTLSGAASTVPIVGATVFTISCLAPDGSHVTNTVSVGLKI